MNRKRLNCSFLEQAKGLLSDGDEAKIQTQIYTQKNNNMKELEKRTELCYVVFDGTAFGVGMTYDLNTAELIISKYNPHAQVMVEGNYISRFEIDILFKSYMIACNDNLSWFILDQDSGVTLIDLVSGELDFHDIIGNEEFSNLNN